MEKYERKLHQEPMLNKLTENARKSFENPLYELLKDERVQLNNALSVAEALHNYDVGPRICNTAQNAMRFNSALSVAEAMKSNHNLDGIQKVIQNAMTVNSAASVAEAMRCCSEIKRSMMGIGAWKELSIAVESVRSVYENPILSTFFKESQRMNQNMELLRNDILSELSRNQSIMQNLFKDTMRDSMMWEEKFKSTIYMTNTASQIAKIFANHNINNLRMTDILANTGCITDLSDYMSRLYENPDLIRDLCLAVDDGNDFADLDAICSEEEDSFSEIQINEFIDVIKSSNYAEKIGNYIEKYGIKGKLFICAVLVWFLQQFVSGFVNYCSAPIYKMIVPSFLSEEAVSGSAKIEIPVNTDVLVWGDVTNNYISVTYELNGSEFSGYITKEELENNAEKISNEVKWEHIVFVEEVVKFFAESWNVSPEKVYDILNEDTNLLDVYLIEHYDVLKDLDNIQRLNLFEKYCEEKGINIKKYVIEKIKEDKAITLDTIKNIK